METKNVLFLFVILLGVVQLALAPSVHAEYFVTNTNTPNEVLYQKADGNKAEDKPYNLKDEESFKEELNNSQGEVMGIDEEGVGYLRGVTENLLGYITAIIFALSAIMIVFAGFRYVGSEGNIRVAQQAKMQIIVAGIGIGIAVMNLVIIQFFKEIIHVLN